MNWVNNIYIITGNTFSSDVLTHRRKIKMLEVLKKSSQEYCAGGLLALGVYCRMLSTSINFENDPWEQKTL